MNTTNTNTTTTTAAAADLLTATAKAAEVANAKIGDTAKALRMVLESRVLPHAIDGVLVYRGRALKSSDFSGKEAYALYRGKMDNLNALFDERRKATTTQAEEDACKKILSALADMLTTFGKWANAPTAKSKPKAADLKWLTDQSCVTVNKTVLHTDGTTKTAASSRLKSGASFDTFVLNYLFFKQNGLSLATSEGKVLAKYYERLAKAAAAAKAAEQTATAEKSGGKSGGKSGKKDSKQAAEKQTAPEQTATAETAAA